MSPARKTVLVTVSLAAIAASGFWIYYQEYKLPRHNVPLHTAVGEVMARETARAIGNRGKVVIVALDREDYPELRTQISAFKHTLKQLGSYDVRNYELDPKDQPKYGVGTGLSGRRYVRIVSKNPDADVVVSFIGAPELKEEDLAQLRGKVPKLIAQARSPDNLPALFEQQLIDVAVVSRFIFPSPGTDNPSTPAEWFLKRYQVVTPANAGILPKVD